LSLASPRSNINLQSQPLRFSASYLALLP